MSLFSHAGSAPALNLSAGQALMRAALATLPAA